VNNLWVETIDKSLFHLIPTFVKNQKYAFHYRSSLGKPSIVRTS
jgi:hypothetical protein